MNKGMVFTTIQKTQALPMSSPISIPLPTSVLTEFTRETFAEALKTNPGALVIKFGAEWCGPCKKIEPLVHKWMSELPASIKCAVIDIDENFEIYAFLKSKRQINGVPAILCYKKGNKTHIPDDVVVGADETQVNLFFERCKSYV